LIETSVEAGEENDAGAPRSTFAVRVRERPRRTAIQVDALELPADHETDGVAVRRPERMPSILRSRHQARGTRFERVNPQSRNGIALREIRDASAIRGNTQKTGGRPEMLLALRQDDELRQTGGRWRTTPLNPAARNR